jgi:hypothetical protein
MTSKEMEIAERKMVLKLLLALAQQREGEDVKLTPCGSLESIESGLTIEKYEGQTTYMLWYNVKKNTHAIKIDCHLKAE